MATPSDSDDIWHDKTLSTREKLQKLADLSQDRPVDLETVVDDETFTPKSRVVPDSENLQLKFKYYLTLMYAAQYRGKCILEELYKNQAETINLLHKTKHGKPVDDSYRNIKAAEIRDMIKDVGWDKESKPKEKKKKTKNKKGKGKEEKKGKITHETSESESEDTERPSTSQKKPKKKTTKETSSDTSDSESEGAGRASTPKTKAKKKRKHETSSDTSDSDSEGAEQTSKSQKRSKKRTPEIGRPSTSKHMPNRKHYKSRTCPICHKSVTIIRRHIINLHVQKNEKIPLARAEARWRTMETKLGVQKERKGKEKAERYFMVDPGKFVPFATESNFI